MPYGGRIIFEMNVFDIICVVKDLHSWHSGLPFVFISGIVAATTPDATSVLCHVKAQTLFRPVEELEQEADMK